LLSQLLAVADVGCLVETRDPTDIDRLVSERSLARRNELDMSQPELAERVGVTFQQVQNTRTARTGFRPAASTEVAKALGVTIQYFYDTASRLMQARRGSPEEAAAFKEPDTSEELELLAAFRRIEFANARKTVVDLAKKQAKSGAEPVRKPAKTRRWSTAELWRSAG